MRGIAANHLLDRRPYPFRILHHLVRPEAHHAPALTFHRPSATRIGFDLKGVVIAVDLDHDLSRDAGEVGEVWTNGTLPPELRVRYPAIAQKFPDLALGATAVAAQIACLVS